MKIMTVLQRIGWVMIASGLLMLTSAGLAQGCYQNPPTVPGNDCATNQAATVANNCLAKKYTPTTSSYCDSRDGECGKLICTVSRVDVTYMRNQGTLQSVPGDPTTFYCEPGEDIGPIGTGTTCAVATLSGDQCGICGGG